MAPPDAASGITGRASDGPAAPAETGVITAPVELRAETTTTGVHRLRFLDGVRGVAALYVVISHIWDTAFTQRPPDQARLREVTAFLGLGRFAVTVFILVSGYSIGLAAWRGGLRWPGGTRRYIRRRVTRIWPPYAIAVLVSSLVAATLLHANDGTLFDAANNIRPLGVISSLFLIQDVHWFGPVGSEAFWSIPVEFHIYFFFLLVLACMRRSRLAPVAFILALMLFTAVAVRTQAGGVVGWMNGLSPSLYALFIIGFLTGRAAVSGTGFSERHWNMLLAAITCLGIAIAIICRHQWKALSPLNDFILGPVAAWLLTQLTLGRLGRLRGVLTSAVAVWIGDCSYSLYLIHAIVIDAVWRFAVVHLTADALARLLLELLFGIPASLICARVFYLAFERPFLRLRSSRPQPGKGSPGVPVTGAAMPPRP